MKYPNVANGVKKIFTAEILQLLAGVCGGAMLLMIAIMAISGKSIEEGTVNGANATGILAGGIGVLIFGLAFFVLAIIAFILNIRGITIAKRDETDSPRNFNTAFWCIIFSIIASIASACLSTVSPTISAALTTVAQICELITTYYVLYGISDFAEKIGNAELASKAKSLVWALCGIYIISVAAKCVGTTASGVVGSTVTAILAVVALIFGIVYYVIYLKLLATAKKAFAEN